MPTKSYAYAVGNVRAKEVALLKKQDIEQMMSMNSVLDLALFLKDKGFGTADTPDDVDLILSAEEEKVWDYVADVAPDFSIFESFLIANDYHNLKAILKSTLVGADYKELLLRPVTVDPQITQKAVEEQKFSYLPEEMAIPAKKAYDALFKIGDSQLCDAFIDSALNISKLQKAEKLKVDMLREMICAGVFYDNIKAAIRCARANKSADFCEICLVDTPCLSKKRLKEATLKGVEELLSLLSSVSKYGCSSAIEAYKDSPSEFERFADNYIMSLALGAKRIAVGAEPLVAYLQAKLTEIKVCRIIRSSVATGEDSQKTREMLRELYG